MNVTQCRLLLRFCHLFTRNSFRRTSYGFRPGRSAHGALRKCEQYINAGVMNRGNYEPYTTITSERLKKAGYITLLDYYRKVRVDY